MTVFTLIFWKQKVKVVEKNDQVAQIFSAISFDHVAPPITHLSKLKSSVHFIISRWVGVLAQADKRDPPSARMTHIGRTAHSAKEQLSKFRITHILVFSSVTCSNSEKKKTQFWNENTLGTRLLIQQTSSRVNSESHIWAAPLLHQIVQ